MSVGQVLMLAFAGIVLVMLLWPIPIKIGFCFFENHVQWIKVSVFRWTWSLHEHISAEPQITPQESLQTTPRDSAPIGSHKASSESSTFPAPSAPSAPSPDTGDDPLDFEGDSFTESSSVPNDQAQAKASRWDRRRLAGVAMDPSIEKRVLRLIVSLITRFIRMFKVSLPTLEVRVGLTDPSQMGQIYGLYHALSACIPGSKGWTLIPKWQGGGLEKLQGLVLVRWRLVSLFLYLLRSLVDLVVLLFLGWRLYRHLRRDPEFLNYSGWRRWILNHWFPLNPPPTEQGMPHDQTQNTRSPSI